MQIEALLVHPDDTLLDAIKTMDRAHIGLALAIGDGGNKWHIL